VAGFLDEDRILAPEVERVRDMVASGELLTRVDAAC
jgi:histidine ammonia-lyase